jgi:DNA-binding transcriptional LysR family regulator
MELMSMDRLRRVAQLWNWLPAFRGVAEHENLQRAASALAVSASALSRTVKLLEDALGADLFVRQTSGLKLTVFGQELLATTRDAMRLVDDCMAAHEARGGMQGPLRIGVADGIAAAMVARTVPVDPAKFGVLHIVRAGDDSSEALLHGDLDLLVSAGTTRSPDVVCEEVGTAGMGIYASAIHPLAAHAGRVEDAELRSAAFVALTSWSNAPHPGARVVIACDAPDVARVLAARAELLCVLPDVVQAAFAPELVRLADAGVRTQVFAMRRKPLDRPSADLRLEALVEALRSTLR